MRPVIKKTKTTYRSRAHQSYFLRAQGEISTITQIFWPNKIVPKIEKNLDDRSDPAERETLHSRNHFTTLTTNNFENGV